MRATTMGLAVAVLVLAASAARAQPAFLLPHPCIPANPIHYGPGTCMNCWYGPNYCFQGPCLPPSPYNGALPFPQQQAPPAQAPGFSPLAGPGPVPGMPGYAPPPLAGFATHPFARSPRDFFMYGQQWTE